MIAGSNNRDRGIQGGIHLAAEGSLIRVRNHLLLSVSSPLYLQMDKSVNYLSRILIPLLCWSIGLFFEDLFDIISLRCSSVQPIGKYDAAHGS